MKSLQVHKTYVAHKFYNTDKFYAFCPITMINQITELHLQTNSPDTWVSSYQIACRCANKHS